jgi:AraC family transcriptional regulator, arabinose operon regulatory protein
MNNQSYYRIEDVDGCDVAVKDKFLVVNCSGVCVLSVPFTTHARFGRRDYYLMYLYQGELEMDIMEIRQMVPAGSIIIFPPGCEYRYMKQGHDELVYYWMHFTGSGAQALLDGCNLETHTVLYAGVSSEAADGFRAMFRNFIHRDGCFEVESAAQLANVCVMLRRKIGGTSPVHMARATEQIQKSLDYIHRHYGGPISVAELAGIEHLSVSRYSAVFRQCTGESPRDFLIGLRLKMAVELMHGTDLNLKQIAMHVGYDDQLYFSRLFKSKKGVSPRQYAASAR